MSNVEVKKDKSPSVDSTSDSTLVDLFSNETLDPVYQAKARILNQAIHKIGMGRYQWFLFSVAGFGWAVDSGAMALVGNIAYSVLAEYHVNPPLLSLSMAIGFFVGACVWGCSSDIWGRRYIFNITLLIGGVFGIASGGANSFVTLASLSAISAMGVGGNVPVDAVVLLDFLPGSHQYLLTAVNAFWGVGFVLAGGIAWGLIPKHACGPFPAVCTKSQNMGWRYYCFATGGLSLFFWAVRFAMPLLESPRYLVGKGQDEEAVKVVHKLAKMNGKTSSLTLEQLLVVNCNDPSERSVLSDQRGLGYIWVTFHHLRALFATPKMALATTLLFIINLLFSTSLALYFTFLPFIIATRGAHFGDASLATSYRNQLIQSISNIPAGFIAGYLVEIPFLGRKRVLAIFGVLTGIILVGSTTAKTSNQLLAWNFSYQFIGIIAYAPLNALGAEIYQGQHRGTGAGLQATATRIAGIMGAIIALYANITTEVPVYIAAATVTCGSLLALFLPYEPRGHSSI